MLVLSRKPGEELIFPEQDIVVTVLEVRGDQVRLGIEASLEKVPVYRGEVWARMKAQADSGSGETSSETPS